MLGILTHHFRSQANTIKAFTRVILAVALVSWGKLPPYAAWHVWPSLLRNTSLCTHKIFIIFSLIFLKVPKVEQMLQNLFIG